MWALSTHRAKRLTRLSGLVPLGTFAAMCGSWVLLLPTMPLMSAARVITCLTAGQDNIVLRHPVWHDTCGGCHSSPAPSGLVALSRESIRWVNLLSVHFKMTCKSVRWRNKKNGHTRHGKQNHQCKACGRQFTANRQDRSIAAEQRRQIEHLLRE